MQWAWAKTSTLSGPGVSGPYQRDAENGQAAYFKMIKTRAGGVNERSPKGSLITGLDDGLNRPAQRTRGAEPASSSSRRRCAVSSIPLGGHRPNRQGGAENISTTKEGCAASSSPHGRDVWGGPWKRFPWSIGFFQPYSYPAGRENGGFGFYAKIRAL